MKWNEAVERVLERENHPLHHLFIMVIYEQALLYAGCYLYDTKEEGTKEGTRLRTLLSKKMCTDAVHLALNLKHPGKCSVVLGGINNRNPLMSGDEEEEDEEDDEEDEEDDDGNDEQNRHHRSTSSSLSSIGNTKVNKTRLIGMNSLRNIGTTQIGRLGGGNTSTSRGDRTPPPGGWIRGPYKKRIKQLPSQVQNADGKWVRASSTSSSSSSSSLKNVTKKKSKKELKKEMKKLKELEKLKNKKRVGRPNKEHKKIRFRIGSQKGRNTAAKSIINELINGVHRDMTTSDHPSAVEYRKVQCRHLLDEIVDHVVDLEERNDRNIDSEVLKVLNDVLTLVETGNAPYVRNQKVKLWLSGQQFMPDILTARVLNRPLNSKEARVFVDRMGGPKIKRPKTAFALYRNEMYKIAKLEKERQENEDSDEDELQEDEEEEEKSSSGAIKKKWNLMSHQEQFKWIDEEAISRYDLGRELYGPTKGK